MTSSSPERWQKCPRCLVTSRYALRCPTCGSLPFTPPEKVFTAPAPPKRAKPKPPPTPDPAPLGPRQEIRAADLQLGDWPVTLAGHRPVIAIQRHPRKGTVIFTVSSGARFTRVFEDVLTVRRPS